MEFGVVFPTSEIGVDPRDIMAYAQAAEEAGADHLVSYDHVLGAERSGRRPDLRGPYGHADDFHEPMVLFGYLAAVTKQLDLVTGVLVLPQRQTALVAKQAAEIDLLSAGRLRLGVGLGWNPVEYEALGVPYERRGLRMEEQVDVLRRLWREPLVDFTGRHHRIDRAAISPRPRRPIPIWLAVTTERGAQRAARLADGAIFPSAAEEYAELAVRARNLAAELGRGPADFGLECMLDFRLGPDSWLRQIERWRTAGGTHVSVHTAIMRSASPPGTSPPFAPSGHIEAVQVFMAAVR